MSAHSNLDAARRVADTVLYEGYVLYPYRASAQKNRSRWQFGVLMPADVAAVDPSESSSAQSECVVEVGPAFQLRVVLRFLQVQRRSVYRYLPETGDFKPVGSLEVDGTPIPSWDEAVEHEVVYDVDDATLSGQGPRHTVRVEGGWEREEIRDAAGNLVGQLVRERRPLLATLGLSAVGVAGPGPALRLRVWVENRTEARAPSASRDVVVSTALVASHLILSVEDGAFVSMVDSPEWARDAVEGCANVGLWPVLAGPPGRRDLLLAAPIILYDHPELAPESPGDLYDATEIDEILLLRTLTLSDAEKREARATDPRAASVLDRAESLDIETLARLHGTIRGFGPAAASEPQGIPNIADPAWVRDPLDPPWWDPGVDGTVDPATDSVVIDGQSVSRGSRVVLRPGARRADAQDMFLAGRAAIVEAVLIDVDDNPYLAVTLADDPDADLLRGHGRFLYFTPDEVEPDPNAPPNATAREMVDLDSPS